MPNSSQELKDYIDRGHLEAILFNAMDAIIVIDENQKIILFNVAAELLFGFSAGEAIGQSIVMLMPEVERDAHEKHVRFFRGEGVTNRKMGALGNLSGLRSNGETFRMEVGISQASVEGKWLATAVIRDITERVELENARNILAQEVDHRAKNALAVVHAIVNLTNADSVEQYKESICGRLDALAHAHSLLATDKWTGGDLCKLIEKELIGFQADGQAILHGPNVTLGVKSVQPLSLLFHELATNALKHGALSHADGVVTIRWNLDDTGALTVRWIESGGPAIEARGQRGFGSSLIESLGNQLQSELINNWLPKGLECSIKLPKGSFKADPEHSHLKELSGLKEPTTLMGRRILIVEDEAIVSLVLTTWLRHDGWEIMGPASTLKAAYELLENEPRPDVALMDLNLDGDPVFPLAHVLQARNIPFAFYSGYVAPVLDPKFEKVPLIAKPTRIPLINKILMQLVVDSKLTALGQ